jgi:hypothetical protein
MPAKLSIAFLGMIVGGVAILIAVTAVYLATAQLQYRSMARLQDRIIQTTPQSTWKQYARFQPSQ